MEMLLKNCLIFGSVLDVSLENERVERVAPNQTDATETIDLQGKIVLPGMIDLHTHIRDLKHSHKETWQTAGAAALAGGVTTVFDMPNTNPPTTTPENLQIKFDACKDAPVNYAVYAGATGNNLYELELMLESGRVPAVKLFMSASSSNEVVENPEAIEAVFRLAKKYNKPVLTHCELQSCITESEALYNDEKYNSVAWHSLIRSRECAVAAVQRVLEIADRVKNALMILHVSTRDEIELIRGYKRSADFPVYVEVTPHHLLLNEAVLQKAGNFGKVNPPLRLREDNEALFEAILDGTVSTIGSDHAPHTITEKQRSYREAPSGFPGLETSLPLLISRALKQKDISLERVVELTSENPAKIMGIKNRGKIEAGYYADLVIVDPNGNEVITPSCFHSKAKYSPFEGITLQGKIANTMVNGNIVNQRGKALF